jgi:hypothetical protein
VITRFLAKHFWSPSQPATLADALPFHRSAYRRAVVIVRVYYAAGFYLAANVMNQWQRYTGDESADPLRPVSWWFDLVSTRTAVNIIFGLYLAASALVALFPERRLLRATYAISLLQYIAFINGFDKSNANLLMWFFVSLALVLLPRGPWRVPRRIAYRQYFLTVVWCAQFLLLFFYSLTGYWKVYTGLTELAEGTMNVFSLHGFSYIVADSLLRTNANTLLGHFFVDHPLAGWPLYIGTMYLEGASVFIAFRPRLHRFWGFGLIAFHVGTQLVMNFTFPENILLIAVLLVCSPFAPDHVSIKATLTDLPGIYFVTRRVRDVRARAARPVGVPGEGSMSPPPTHGSEVRQP